MQPCLRRTIGRAGKATSPQLTIKAVKDLISGNLSCIWVKNYFDADGLTSVISRILADEPGMGVVDDTGVSNIGVPISTLLCSDGTYLDKVSAFRSYLCGRDFLDRPNPWDRFVIDLGKIWPSGAAAASIKGSQVMHFIFRIYHAGSCLRPHIDRKDEAIISSLCSEARLAANLYLATPPRGSGGELMLWDTTMPENEYEQVRHLELDQFSARIGPPAMVIEPADGDLILFDGQKIHCVGALQSGVRVTASSFLGIADEHMPLSVFA